MVLSAPIIFKRHMQVQLKQERLVKLILAIAFEVIRTSYVVLSKTQNAIVTVIANLSRAYCVRGTTKYCGYKNSSSMHAVLT